MSNWDDVMSAWDFRSNTAWLMPSEDGFWITAADITELAAKAYDRILQEHPELEEDDPDITTNEEIYDEETGRYRYEDRPAKSHLGRSFKWYVDQLPKEAYKLYEWIYRELKKGRLPYEYRYDNDYYGPTDPDTGELSEVSGERTRKQHYLTHDVHEDFKSMFPAPLVTEEDDQGPDELEGLDADYTPETTDETVDPMQRYMNEEPYVNEFGEEFLPYQFTYEQHDSIAVIRMFLTNLQWLQAHNKPVPNYKSKQFTFPMMMRWNQLFRVAKAKAFSNGYEESNVVFTCSNGWRIEERKTQGDMTLEGNLMGHCVGGYTNYVANGMIHIFSLVDRAGKPHVTVEFAIERDADGNEVDWPGQAKQIRGKQNILPIPEYQALIKEWIESLGHPVYYHGEYAATQTLRPSSVLVVEDLDGLQLVYQHLQNESDELTLPRFEVTTDGMGISNKKWVSAPIAIRIRYDRLIRDVFEKLQMLNRYENNDHILIDQGNVVGQWFTELRAVWAAQYRIQQLFEQSGDQTLIDAFTNYWSAALNPDRARTQITEYANYYISDMELRDYVIQLWDSAFGHLANDNTPPTDSMQQRLFSKWQRPGSAWLAHESKWLVFADAGFFLDGSTLPHVLAADMGQLASAMRERILNDQSLQNWLSLDSDDYSSSEYGTANSVLSMYIDNRAFITRVLAELPDATYKFFPWLVRALRLGDLQSLQEPRHLLREWEMPLTEAAEIYNYLDAKHLPLPNLNARAFDVIALEAFVNDNVKVLEDLGFEVGPGYGTNRVIFDFGDGWMMKEVLNSQDCDVEGTEMQNCIRQYDQYHWDDGINDGFIHIYSLRDPRNYPHVSIQTVGESDGAYRSGVMAVCQYYGKQNRAPEERYQKYIDIWYEHLRGQGLQIEEECGSWDPDDQEVEHEPEHLYEYDEYDAHSDGDYYITDLSDLEAYWWALQHGTQQFLQDEEGDPFEVDENGDYAYRYHYGQEVVIDGYDIQSIWAEIEDHALNGSATREQLVTWGQALVTAVRHGEHRGDSEEGTLDELVEEAGESLAESYAAGHEEQQQLFEPEEPEFNGWANRNVNDPRLSLLHFFVSYMVQILRLPSNTFSYPHHEQTDFNRNRLPNAERYQHHVRVDSTPTPQSQEWQIPHPLDFNHRAPGPITDAWWRANSSHRFAILRHGKLIPSAWRTFNDKERRQLVR